MISVIYFPQKICYIKYSYRCSEFSFSLFFKFGESMNFMSKLGPSSSLVSGLHRRGARFITYVSTEKLMLNAFSKEYQTNERKWRRDVEINTMKSGLQIIASKGFRIEDVPGMSELKLIRDNDEELLEAEGISSVTVDFDCWARAMKDGNPEAYDVIIRKAAADHYLVITCINMPNLLPVGVRIIPNHEQSDNLKLYNGPRLTRLPDKLLTGVVQYLQTAGVDDDLGGFIHRYIDFKVRKEMHGALHHAVNSALTDTITV